MIFIRFFFLSCLCDETSYPVFNLFEQRQKGKRLNFEDEDMGSFDDSDDEADGKEFSKASKGRRGNQGKKVKKRSRERKIGRRSRASSFASDDDYGYDQYADDDERDNYNQDQDDLELTAYFKKKNKERFLAAFRQIDSDHNGHIDVDEPDCTASRILRSSLSRVG